MNLSIFDNDGGLGSVNSRGVVIELRGQTPQLSIYYTAEAQLIKDTLNNNGWNVSLVVETSGGIFGYGSRTWKIYATVLNQYTNSDIPSYVRRDLANVMTVHDVRLLGESSVPANPNGWASSDNPAGNSPIAWAGNQATKAAEAIADAASSEFMYYAIGGGLLLILLLRR